MADEELELEEKPKKPIVKIALIGVAAILVLVITVVGTLFVSGFFDHKDTHAAEQALKEPEEKKANESKAAESEATPEKVAKETPELTRFERHEQDAGKIRRLRRHRRNLLHQLCGAVRSGPTEPNDLNHG